VLRNTARPRIVPVALSSWLSEEVERPFARIALVVGERHGDAAIDRSAILRFAPAVYFR
jgi:hypothetical protein